MKNCKRFLLLLTSILFVTAINAQTADEIINKHIEAMGGKEKLAQLKSLHMDITMQIMGNDAPASITVKEGKGYKSESEAMGQKIVSCVTDSGGWMINPMMGAAGAQPIPAEQYKETEDQIYATGPFYNYNEKGIKVELEGQEKIGDVDAYKLKVTNKDGGETTYYVDPTTYYIVRVVKSGEMMGNPVTIAVNNSDFQKTDEGYVVPRTVETSFGEQFSMTAKVTKVDINPTVEDSIFTMPQ